MIYFGKIRWQRNSPRIIIKIPIEKDKYHCKALLSMMLLDPIPLLIFKQIKTNLPYCLFIGGFLVRTIGLVKIFIKMHEFRIRWWICWTANLSLLTLVIKVWVSFKTLIDKTYERKKNAYLYCHLSRDFFIRHNELYRASNKLDWCRFSPPKKFGNFR